LGIDFGTDNSVVAIARRKGVDIVANEASQRLTPCIVSFDSKQRYIGEGGLSQRITNIKNTVVEPKNLIGRSCSD
ncbi:heat shock protein 70 family, partial [Baffinella frigidus]